MNSRQTTLEQSAVWLALARLVVLVCAALAVTSLGLPQWITGPLVNALLILSVEWGGVTQAVIVGLITPLGAAAHGILPLPLLVMVPFIALGNAALASVYGALRGAHRGLALVAAAALKFAVLYGAVMLLVVRPLTLMVAGVPHQVAMPDSMVQMMAWPQLATALAGGLIALGIRAGYQRLGRR